MEKSGVSAHEGARREGALREGAEREGAERASANRAAERWLKIHDELLRGLAHALSNRVATIDAATYMLGLDGADVQGQSATLRGEIERLEALLNAMRVLPRQADAAAEPVMAADVTQAALTLMVHHGELRDVHCDVVMDGDVPPMFVDPHALQHALLVAIAAAGRAAGRAGISLQVSSNGDIVRFSAAPRDVGAGMLGDGGAVKHFVDAEAIDWLLAAYDGVATPVRGGAEFTVPTLSAARRAGR